MSSSSSVQQLAQKFERQSTQNPFVPKPKPLPMFKPIKTVRRSISSPQLFSQIPQTSQIKAAATVQTLSLTPPSAAEKSLNPSNSSPFSLSGSYRYIVLILF